MSNPNTFMVQYAAQIKLLCDTLEQMRILNSVLKSDSTLLDRYFTVDGSGMNDQGQKPRTDIAKADVTAALNASDQVVIAYDSGAPTQKSQLFKMLQ